MQQCGFLTSLPPHSFCVPSYLFSSTNSSQSQGTDNLAGPSTPLPGLVCTGDSVWPGIGVPAVAASGTLVANMMVSPFQQLRMLDRIDFGGVGIADE